MGYDTGMSSPTVQQSLPWWKRWKQRKGLLGSLTSGGFSAIFWNLERIIGLAGAPEDISRWRQGFMGTLDMILEWSQNIAFMFLGGAIVLLVPFIAEKLGFWFSADHKLFWRIGFHRLRGAPRNIGWVTVRYGVGYKDTKNESRSQSRRVWKGKTTSLIFPNHDENFCFIEFPDTYKAVIHPTPGGDWQACPASSPGYRRYESSLPLDNIIWVTDVNSQVASVVIGTDDNGTGGWSAAWMDIKCAFEAIVKGRVTK